MVAHKLRLVAHHRLDRARGRVPRRNAGPDRHDGARLRPALRQGLRRHRRGRPHRGLLHRVRGRRHQPRADRRRRTRPGHARSTASAWPRARSAATRCSPTTTARPSSPAGGAAHHGLHPGRGRDPPRRRRDPLRARRPDGRHEVVIDATSAEENDIELGSTIKVLFRGPDRGVHRRRHRRLRRREGPRRHHVGVLRHRDRAEACSAPRASSTPSTSARTTV